MIKIKKEKRVKFCLFTIGLLCLVFFVIVQIGKSTKTNTVNAKPDDGSKIVIDNGTSDSLELPFDNLGLKEQYLQDKTPLYDEYDQNDGSVDVLMKKYINGYYDYRGLEAQVNLKMSIQLDNGNFIVMCSKQQPATYSGLFAVHVDQDGNTLDTLDWHGQGTSSPSNYYRFDGIVGKANKPNTIYVTGAYASSTGIMELSVDALNKISVTKIANYPSGTGATVAYNDVEVDGKPLLSSQLSGIVPSSDYGAARVPTYLFENGTTVSNHIRLERPRLSAFGAANASYFLQANEMTSTNRFFISGNVFYNNTQVYVYPYLAINDKDGNLIDYYYNTANKRGRITLFNSLCTEEEVWWQETYPSDATMTIKKALLNNDGTIQSVETVLDFPANSSIYLISEGSTLSYLGYLGSSTMPVFDKWKVPAGSIISGTVDSNFNFQSAIYEQVEGAVQFKNVIPFYKDGVLNYFYSGDTYSNAVLDDIYTHPNFGGSTPPANKLKTFWGRSEIKVDYPPAIFEGDNTIVNNTLTDAMTETEFNNYVIFGNKNGTINSDSVQVFDRFDVELYSYGGNNEADRLKDLYSRINRNSNKLTNPIDWPALGLDIKVAGPQLVTYFVGDYQLQLSSTSKIVSVVDKQTVYDDEYALKVDNFVLNADQLDLGTLVKSDLLTNSNALAWIHKGSNVGDKDTDNIEYNTAQWDVILDAYDDYKDLRGTESISYEDFSDILKPYPLTFTYTHGSEVLTREVSVYLTNDITNVDIDKNYVYYADNFRYPLRNASSLTDQDLINETHSRVYIFDTFDYASNTAVSLNNLSSNRQDSDGVNHATVENTYDLKMSANNNKYINEKAKAFLYENGRLKVRQVIENASEELVVPTEGYFTLASDTTGNTDASLLNNGMFTIGATMPSGEGEATVGYREVEVPTQYGKYTYWMRTIIPSYYKISQVTDKDGAVVNLVSSELGELIRFEYSSTEEEYEFTIYLEPVDGAETKPSLYSWDYKLNDLGEIKP